MFRRRQRGAKAGGCAVGVDGADVFALVLAFRRIGQFAVTEDLDGENARRGVRRNQPAGAAFRRDGFQIAVQPQVAGEQADLGAVDKNAHGHFAGAETPVVKLDGVPRRVEQRILVVRGLPAAAVAGFLTVMAGDGDQRWGEVWGALGDPAVDGAVLESELGIELAGAGHDGGAVQFHAVCPDAQQAVFRNEGDRDAKAQGGAAQPQRGEIGTVVCGPPFGDDVAQRVGDCDCAVTCIRLCRRPAGDITALHAVYMSADCHSLAQSPKLGPGWREAPWRVGSRCPSSPGLAQGLNAIFAAEKRVGGEMPGYVAVR